MVIKVLSLDRVRTASRSSTFQFHVVVVSGEFKVFSQNRVQQRSPSSRSLTFLLVVALDRVRPHLLVLQMRIFLGGFRTFPHGKKVRSGRAGPAPARQLIHDGGSARLVVGVTHSCSVGRVGAGQGGSEEGAREQEEEKEEEEEAAAEVLCATSLPSRIRTRKSGHYFTSPSFWLWFLPPFFFTCWTRILRSFLISAFFYAPLVSGSHWFGVCLARDIQKNWIFCETTSVIISCEPLVFGSHFTVFGVAFGEEDYGFSGR